MTIPTLTRNASAAGPQLYWMGDGSEQYEVERESLVTDIEGEHLCTLIGVSDPFQYTSKQWGEKTGIRLLFEVANKERKGDRFSLMFGYSIGPKSRLTPLIEALRRQPIGEGDEVSLGALIGEHAHLFLTIGTTVKDGTTYQNTNFNGARPYVPTAAVKQPPKPAKAAPIEDDPFNDE